MYSEDGREEFHSKIGRRTIVATWKPYNFKIGNDAVYDWRCEQPDTLYTALCLIPYNINLILHKLSPLTLTCVSYGYFYYVWKTYWCHYVWNIHTHTYIFGYYNPSVRITDLVSHTTHVVVCVNFIHKWWDLQLIVDSERQIFWETFHGNLYLLSEFLQKICWEEISAEILFVFCFDVWPVARTLAFRLISQHTIY